MSSLAIIGGSGFSKLSALVVQDAYSVETPYGATSAPVTRGTLNGHEYFFFRVTVLGIIYHRILLTIAPIYGRCASVVRSAWWIAAVGGITPRFAPACWQFLINY
ncbi:hypothetical protein [Chromatium okenii]|uniref:hypothetical protein n=1 Tax=Chromatium okenii TaxID=61644 RepID=UPI003221AD62